MSEAPANFFGKKELLLVGEPKWGYFIGSKKYLVLIHRFTDHPSKTLEMVGRGSTRETFAPDRRVILQTLPILNPFMDPGEQVTIKTMRMI
jgi:hypothetical protein